MNFCLFGRCPGMLIELAVSASGLCVIGSAEFNLLSWSFSWCLNARLRPRSPRLEFPQTDLWSPFLLDVLWSRWLLMRTPLLWHRMPRWFPQQLQPPPQLGLLWFRLIFHFRIAPSSTTRTFRLPFRTHQLEGDFLVLCEWTRLQLKCLSLVSVPFEGLRLRTRLQPPLGLLAEFKSEDTSDVR